MNNIYDDKNQKHSVETGLKPVSAIQIFLPSAFRPLFSVLCLLLLVLCPLVRAETADQWVTKGKELYQKGDFEHAAIAWEQAVRVLDKEKDTGRYLDAVMYLTEIYQSLGYHEQALHLFHETLPIAEKSSDLNRNSRFLSGLGDLYLSLGKADQADKYLNPALEKARLSNNPRLISSVMINVGNLLTADADYDAAIDAYTESLELIKPIKNKSSLQTKALLNLLYATVLAGDEEPIKDLVKQTFSGIDHLSDSLEKASNLISLSLIIQTIRNDAGLSNDIRSDKELITIAHQALNHAKQIAQDISNPRIASNAYGYLGQLYEQEKQYSDGLKLTRSAIFYAQQGNIPDKLYIWQWQMGRLFKATGDNEKAIMAYQNAITTLNPIRSELFRGLRLEKDMFNEQIKPVFLGMAELYLNTGKLKEARDTMELLKASELQDFFKDECTTLMQSKMSAIDQTPAKTAILYPIVLKDSLAILLTLPDGIHYINSPVDSKTLQETIAQFRFQLQNRLNNRFLYQAEQLYEWLIRPIEAKLAPHEVDTLVIAPDGALRLIPMSTLYDGKQFLIEKYAIAVIPAITLIDPKPFQQANMNVLLCGLSEARQDFSPLPSVPAELSDIKQIMDGKIVLMNKDFIASNITAEFKTNEYAILHMATHGVFGGTPQESFLLNYDTKLTMDDLEQLIGIARFREKPVEILTLSACQTALGNERAALGLAGVAVKAGVRSAIATLWYVDDEATSLAIRDFYRQIKTPGISKAKALQNVQKKLISKPRYWQPLYWAPFVLIGNWM